MNKLFEALRNAGIPEPTKETETFKIVRWGHKNRYWLRKFEGGYVFGDFVSGLNSYVFEQEYKGAKLKEVQKKMHQASTALEVELQKSYAECSKIAQRIWAAANIIETQESRTGSTEPQTGFQKAQMGSQKLETDSEEASRGFHHFPQNTSKNSLHPYLLRKKVDLYGVREYKGSLVVPAYDQNGKLWTLQFISASGEKRFLAGGRKKGCFFTIGLLDNADKIFICEGYATGATIYECSDKKPVVVAFDASGLKSVSQIISKKVPSAKIIICADNDCYHENNFNPGVEKAREAALSIGAQVVIPKFKDSTTHPTDFNDLYILEGRDAVRAILENVNENESDIPSGFVLSNEGLLCIDKKGNPVQISNYIKVIAFTRSSDGISKLVEFRDYKNDLRRTIVKPKMLSKDGDAIRVHLVSHGFVYSGTGLSKRKLFEYISSSVPKKETILISRTGYFENMYIRSDRVIGKTNDGVILDDSVNDESIAIAGTLQEWNENIAKYCVGNSRLSFAISAAFASILMKSCDLQNFGFHFVGNSSSGKTTCLNVAASVFGTPQYVVTWKATDNALENVAYKHNDALLILDELSEVSPSKAGEVAYMLANGQGKKRLDKNCEARETLSWRLIFLSSGEVDLTSHMAEDNKTSKAGQKVRLLNIPAKANEKSFGIFEDLHDFKDGAEFSNYLRSASAKYYGTPAVAFIEKVLEEKESIRRQFDQEYQKLKMQYLPEKSEGQDQRAFERFMFAGFAGELAIKYGVLNFPQGTLRRAAISCFNSWLEDKEGVGDDENRQILEHVKGFFELHGHSRFFDLGGFPGQKIANMAGYKSVYQDAVMFYVSPSVFQNEICKRFNRKTVINLLIEKGFLQKDHNGDYRQQKWTPYGNKKVYVISGKILLG